MYATFPSRLSRLYMVVFLLAAGLAIPPRIVNAIVGATFTVNSNSDADSGIDGVCTLREAIISARNDADHNECTHTGSFGNDVIVFSISGNTTITLAADLPSIAFGNLTIDGSNSGRAVVIDGAATYKIFDIPGGYTFILQNITVQHGQSGGLGGGGAINAGTMYVLNSSFLNNVSSGEGGAIDNFGGTLTIANSTISGNSAAAGYGGGVMDNNGTATILNSTFSGNTALHGGALSTWSGSSLTVINTIMANSSGSADCENNSGGPLTGNHNIIETTTIDAATCSSITTSTSDPKLGSLAGSPVYFPLLSGSPAFDAGDNAVCASYPINNTSQNGVHRPQGAHCEIGSYEVPLSLTFKSTGTQDGWVLESSETSSHGGSFNSSSTTFRLGDDSTKKQYLGVLSFGTGVLLPDTAVIVKVTLKLKKQNITGGGNPVTTFQGFMLDIKKGFFGTSALQAADFQTSAGHAAYGPFSPALTGGWYNLDLTSGSIYVNKLGTAATGLTQIRVRFMKDDNNNAIANYLSLYSGDAGSTSRPQLVVQYYLP